MPDNGISDSEGEVEISEIGEGEWQGEQELGESGKGCVGRSWERGGGEGDVGFAYRFL